MSETMRRLVGVLKDERVPHPEQVVRTILQEIRDQPIDGMGKALLDLGFIGQIGAVQACELWACRVDHILKGEE